MPWRPEDFTPYNRSDYDYDTQIFERPREALEHLKEELRSEYRATKTRESFIAQARRDHLHLRDLDDSTINQEIDRLIIHGGQPSSQHPLLWWGGTNLAMISFTPVRR